MVSKAINRSYTKYIELPLQSSINPQMADFKNKAYVDMTGDMYTSITNYLKKRIQIKDYKGKKPVVVFDIDETTLFSLPHLTYNGKNINGQALPGVLNLYNFLKKNGISVIFVTARLATGEAFTRKQLAQLGFKGYDGLIMMPFKITMPNKTIQSMMDHATYKNNARKQINNSGYYIIANIGDQLTDFYDPDKIVETHFYIPNLFY